LHAETHYESSEISTRPLFSPSLGPAGYPGDGQLLERVADLLIELHLHPEGPSPKKSVSLRSAIKRALQEAGKSKDIDVDIRRLTRLWKMDEDYRSQRAVARYVKKRTGTETAFDKKENPRRGK
jgi:hypothetical protein